MSIQRYHFYNIYGTPIPDNKVMAENGDYVLYTAHAAEVERLTGERDESRVLYRTALDRLIEVEKERDAAVRERDAAVEALRFYAEEDRQSVELEILESVDLRPATAALAKIEGGQHA